MPSTNGERDRQWSHTTYKTHTEWQPAGLYAIKAARNLLQKPLLVTAARVRSRPRSLTAGVARRVLSNLGDMHSTLGNPVPESSQRRVPYLWSLSSKEQPALRFPPKAPARPRAGPSCWC